MLMVTRNETQARIDETRAKMRNPGTTATIDVNARMDEMKAKMEQRENATIGQSIEERKRAAEAKRICINTAIEKERAATRQAMNTCRAEIEACNKK